MSIDLTIHALRRHDEETVLEAFTGERDEWPPEELPNELFDVWGSWACFWFLLDPEDRDRVERRWGSPHVVSLRSGAIIGRRLSPHIDPLHGTDALERFRYNTPADVAEIVAALDVPPGLALPAPDALSRANVYHPRTLP